MKLNAIAIVGLLGMASLAGCKTTEANYRAAYEKTIAARQESGDSIENTIYGLERAKVTTGTVETTSGTFEMRSMMVKVTDGGGGIREHLRQYNAVVGQFKQRFNAESLRERLVDAGYAGAFIVETAEPYYYVVLKSSGNIDEAAMAIAKLRADGSFVMREPCPFLLNAAPLSRQFPVQKRG